MGVNVTLQKPQPRNPICFFLVTAYKAMAAALDGDGATRYETVMKPIWNWYETNMKPI